MITYSVTLIIYFLFPTCQMLRPEVFPRDNALTRFIAGFYVFDTNTNVCPRCMSSVRSRHFLPSGMRRSFSAKKWRIASAIAAFLICISTVFMKQHSVLDVLAALPLCAIAYYFAYRKPLRRARSASGSLSR